MTCEPCQKTTNTTVASARTVEHRPAPEAAAEVEREHEHRGDREPDDGRRPGGRQHGEGGDADHGADDVDAVGPQRRHALEQRPKRQGQAGRQRDDQARDEGQDQEVEVGGAAFRQSEEDLVLGAHLDVELERVDQEGDDQQQERERHERRVPALPPEQDAQADAQEARDQQEVAEEADVADVGRNPADEQQLHEQDREAGQEEANVVTRKNAQLTLLWGLIRRYGWRQWAC